jgi:hypothetical protein
VKIYYDTEFLEDGRTIELISIGMVAEDGREFYAVNRDAPWKRIKKHEWLMANVVPSLPQPHGDWILHMPKSWLIDFHNPAVKTKRRIAEEVRIFLLGEDPHDVPDIELWAWYGAYDHVALAQLFGRMIDLPAGVPMWTSDLRQEVARLGDPDLPKQADGQHNALADARHIKVMAEFLSAVSRGT